MRDYRINGKRSLASVERRTRLHLEPYFGGRRMAANNTGDVAAYTDRRQSQGASNASVNRELAILKRAFVLAMGAGTLLHHAERVSAVQHNGWRGRKAGARKTGDGGNRERKG